MNTTPFTITSVLNESWQLIKGSKWAVWAILIPIGILIALLNTLMIHAFGIKHSTSILNSLLMPIVTNLLIAPFYAGALMVAIKKARGEPVSAKTGYGYFERYIPVAITLIILSSVVSIPSACVKALGAFDVIQKGTQEFLEVIVLIVSILFYTFLILSVPLATDKKYSPLLAMKTSIQLIKPHWIKTFLTIIVADLYFVLALVPLLFSLFLNNPLVILLGFLISFIALIWVVPFLLMVQGVIYRIFVNVPRAAA